MIVPLLCLGNFWRSLETPLINCEIKVILTWSEEGHCTKPYFPSPGISWKDKKDQVNIIFLVEKETIFSITKNFKTRRFQ